MVKINTLLPSPTPLHIESGYGTTSRYLSSDPNGEGYTEESNELDIRDNTPMCNTQGFGHGDGIAEEIDSDESFIFFGYDNTESDYYDPDM